MSWHAEVESLETAISDTLEKLKSWNDKELKNSLEFFLNYLNIALATNEADIDDIDEELSLGINKRFIEIRPTFKSDSVCSATVKEAFHEDLHALAKERNTIKKYNRIHKGFIRLADHLTGRVIQENFDTKRSWY